MRSIWWAKLIAMALAVGCSACRVPAHVDVAQVSTPAVQAALASASKPSAQALLLQAIGDHRIALLGEMHGTRETPALAGQLVSLYAAAHRPVLLGLEIDRGEQGDVDRFLASNGDASARRALLAGAHWRAPFDGRDSEAIFQLIEHVRQLRVTGADVRIVYFDDHDPDMDQRNQRMADTLRAAAREHPGAMLLVLTGNVHAMTHRLPGELYSDGKRIELPMTTGRYLADLGAVSIDVSGASGEYSACMAGSCGPHPVRDRGSRTEPSLVKEAPSESAWDFSLTLPRFHVSPPAVTH